MPKLDIRNCDCMDLMAEFPDKHFELAIVDPPYGIGDFTRSTAHGKKPVRNYSRPTWNNEIPTTRYFEELKRVSEKTVIWGANYFNCFEGGALVWYKGLQANTLSHCEIASLSFQKKVDYVRINWQAGFHRTATEGQQIHPCQKPVKLYRWLLEHYAKPGDKILDTHCGSGSIAIACHYMGFDLTACELDKGYYNAAMKRIAEETKQISLL